MAMFIIQLKMKKQAISLFNFSEDIVLTPNSSFSKVFGELWKHGLKTFRY